MLLLNLYQIWTNFGEEKEQLKKPFEIIVLNFILTINMRWSLKKIPKTEAKKVGTYINSRY